MQNILEELWYGNIYSGIECRETTTEAKEMMKYAGIHHDNLKATLTDEQKKLLEKFDESDAEVTSINERDIFVYAFRLGARIAIEIMSLKIK